MDKMNNIFWFLMFLDTIYQNFMYYIKYFLNNNNENNNSEKSNSI